MCYAQLRLGEDEWLWICRAKDNPFSGISLTQKQIEDWIDKIIKNRIMELLDNYLEAIEKADKE